MGAGNSKVNVNSKSYAVQDDNGQWEAVIHITINDSLIEAQWDKKFDTKEACIEFLQQNSHGIVEKVCHEIGLEFEKSHFGIPDKKLH